MSVTYHERPGVYVDYDASSVSARAQGVKTVALVAVSSAAAGVHTLTTAAQAEQCAAVTTAAGKLLQLLYANGAQRVLFSPASAATKAAYSAALALLDPEQADIFVLDSGELEPQQTLRTWLMARAAQGAGCIGLVGMAQPTAVQLITRAGLLNCERMVLVGPDVRYTGETDWGGGCLAAAALAGVLAAQTDPALPLNGAVLAGLSAVSCGWTETELDQLVQGGVTPVELAGGQVSVIRGQTTRTKTGGVTDATYRELTMMLVIDEVLGSVRSALAAKFARRKNTAATRSAIRAQVAIELEERVRREIIGSYGDLSVTALASDPTVCLVEFTFSVVHGLSRIYLTAHIQV